MVAKHCLDLFRDGYAPLFGIPLMFHLDKLRIDLEWAKYAADCRSQKKAVKSWSQFDKKYVASRGLPIFTWTVILLCGLIHCYRMSICDEDWMLNNTDSDPLFKAFVYAAFGDKRRLEYYQIFTSMFLHGSVQHLITNMLLMFLLGSKSEQIHGSGVISFIFFISGCGGKIAFTLLCVERCSLLGASSAICGLSGLIYADIWTNWDLLEADMKHVNFMLDKLSLEWGVYLLRGFLQYHAVIQSNTSQSAHAGALYFGFCLAFLVVKHSRATPGDKGNVRRFLGQYAVCLPPPGTSGCMIISVSVQRFN